MSGPPGTGIISRGPYSGLPSVGGAPKRGLERDLPSGKAQGSFKNDMIEPMANATATHPFFIAPMQQSNIIYENDILMLQTSGKDGKESNNYSNLGSDYGVYARPLRLLSSTKGSFLDENGNEKEYTLEAAKAEIMRWKCMGIVVSVGAGHDHDRQLVNVAIRGRIGAPNIFRSTTTVGDKQFPTARGDLLCVKISAVKKENGEYELKVSTAVLKSPTDVPGLEEDEEFATFQVLGTYIRQLANPNASKTSIAGYLEGDKSILDRKATYELALRL